MRRAIPIAVLAALCLVLAGRAVAQKKPSPAEIEEAKEHYTRAQAYLDLKEYEKAVQEFLAAHALFPDPEFYFNVAEAYRLKGDRDLALDYYKKYLNEAPDGRVARLAASSVGEIEAVLSEERRLAEEAARKKAEEAARKKAEEEARKKAEEEARRKADEEERRQAEEVRRKAEEEEGRKPDERTLVEPDQGVKIRAPAPARPGRTLKLAGLGAAGVGLVAIAVGVKFGLDARSLGDEVSDVGSAPGDSWTDDNLDKISRGESAESKMFLFTGLGAAVAITGGVLYFLGSRKDARADEAGALAVTPSLSSTGAGIALTGNF